MYAYGTPSHGPSMAIRPHLGVGLLHIMVPLTHLVLNFRAGPMLGRGTPYRLERLEVSFPGPIAELVARLRLLE